MTIYLNNAATTYPKPSNVIAAVDAFVRNMPANSVRSGFGVKQEDVIGACRRKLAELFNAPNPKRIVFTSGSTEALNLAIMGMKFRKAHIITTSSEHNSVYRPLKKLEGEGHITLTIVECDEDGAVSVPGIAAAVQENTRAIVVNHCSNVTGRTAPLKEIGHIAHDHGAVFIVDSSQAAGNVPVDVQRDGIDMMAFTGHKSLYGLPGIGGLYINENFKPEPLKFGGTGVNGELLTQPEEMPMYYEAGTQNKMGIAALNAGLDFIAQTGFQTIANRKKELTAKVINAFREIPNLILYGHKNERFDTSVVCFNIEGTAPSEVGYMLGESFDIVARAGLHCAPLIHKNLGSYPAGNVRVSPSYFTTDEEIERLIEAVIQISEAERK